MTTARILPLAFLVATCFSPQVASATTAFQCLDLGGKRVGWADIASQCPPSSRAVAYVPPDICVIPGVCETVAPPSGAQPLEFICCAFVSGDSACHWVAEAVGCPADMFLASCEWGVTEQNGDVTCYD
jgi:hypothetical protein